MAQSFPETAHLSTDRKKYGDNYDHVFSREKCQCEECLKEKPNPENPDSSEPSP